MFIKQHHDKPNILAELAYTLQHAREAMPFRMAMVVSDVVELKEKLQFFHDNSNDVHDLNQKMISAVVILILVMTSVFNN